MDYLGNKKTERCSITSIRRNYGYLLDSYNCVVCKAVSVKTNLQNEKKPAGSILIKFIL